MSGVRRNTFIYTLGNALPKTAGFFLLPIYTAYLSPAEYGVVNSVNVLVPILTVLFSLGFDASIFRLYWDCKTDQEQTAFFSTIFFTTAGTSIIMLAVILLFHQTVSRIYTSIEFFPYFFYMVISVFVSNFFHLPQRYLMLKGRAGQFVVLSAVRFFINAALILWFIIRAGQGAAGYLKASMITACILILPYACITLKLIRWRFSLPMLRSLLHFSLPLIPTLLSGWVVNLSDRIFIERFCDLKNVGIYSLAYAISGVILIIVNAFHMAYRPVFFRYANAEDQEEGRRTIFNYNSQFLLVVMLIVFAVILFSREIIGILFEEQYASAAFYIPLIALSYLFNAFCSLLGRFFEQSKKMKTTMVIAVATALLNLLLNYLLIPRFGAYGAALATLITFVCIFVVRYMYVRKYCYFVPFHWKLILPLAFGMIILFGFFDMLVPFENLLLSAGLKAVLIFLLLIGFYLRYQQVIHQMLSDRKIDSRGGPAS